MILSYASAGSSMLFTFLMTRPAAGAHGRNSQTFVEISVFQLGATWKRYGRDHDTRPPNSHRQFEG